MTLIKWKQRAAQVKDYENLILNGYTPTDIDFIYDVMGRKYVIGELKLVGAPMPEGQRRMLLADGDITREEFVRLQYSEGLTENGQPIAVCFFSPDPLVRALCTIEGFEEPTIFTDNDPEQIKAAIQRSKSKVLELLATTRSISQRKKAELSWAALDWLEGEYDIIMMANVREAVAEMEQAARENPEEAMQEDEQEDQQEDDVE